MNAHLATPPIAPAMLSKVPKNVTSIAFLMNLAASFIPKLSNRNKTIKTRVSFFFRKFTLRGIVFQPLILMRREQLFNQLKPLHLRGL
mgnify:CR=1 FL=1